MSQVLLCCLVQPYASPKPKRDESLTSLSTLSLLREDSRAHLMLSRSASHWRRALRCDSTALFCTASHHRRSVLQSISERKNERGGRGGGAGEKTVSDNRKLQSIQEYTHLHGLDADLPSIKGNEVTGKQVEMMQLAAELESLRGDMSTLDRRHDIRARLAELRKD